MRRSRAFTVLLSTLVVALLVPTGVLFAEAWRAAGERARATALETDGVAYLRSLQGVAFAVADAQSAAVSGKPAPRDAITAAVRETDATDERLGATLRTTERWTGVRERLEALRDNPPADPSQALTAFREVGDLVLALYAKVRDRSGLVHDPDADAFHLQSGAAGDLPVAVISAGRLSDIVVLAAGARAATPGTTPPAADPERQLDLVARLAAERVTMVDAATRLVDNLRSAVDNTQSRTLGGNLLSRLDRFQRAADIVAAIAGQIDGSAGGDPSRVVLARAELQAAAGELSSAILTEVEGLLDTRAGGIDRTRLFTGGAAAAAVLLVAGFLAALFLSGRPRQDAEAPATPAPPPAPGDAGLPRRTPVALRAGPDPIDQIAQWERSGAPR